MKSSKAAIPNEFFRNVLTAEISMLPIDHPGAHDPAYRERRDRIAKLARSYREDPEHRIPVIVYTADETQVWRLVCAELKEAHRRHAHSFYLRSKEVLGITALPAEAPEELDRVHVRLDVLGGLVVDARRSAPTSILLPRVAQHLLAVHLLVRDSEGARRLSFRRSVHPSCGDRPGPSAPVPALDAACAVSPRP